jgi:hypothetical protein
VRGEDMANKEVCEVFIEQQIEEGLQEGKTPYSIAQELSAWVEKLFQAKIPEETVKSRAYRVQQRIGSNEPKPATPDPAKENEDIQDEKPIDEPHHGGSRLGAGRPRRYGTDKDWRSLVELMDQVKEICSRVEGLTVDDMHRIMARDLCLQVAKCFEKLATKMQG